MRVFGVRGSGRNLWRGKKPLRSVWLMAAVLGAFLMASMAYQSEAMSQQGAKEKQGAKKTRKVEKAGCELQNFRKSAKFLAEAWAVPDERFNVGEPLRLQMRVSSPAYMNVFHVSTSCKVTRLVHNRKMVETQIVDFPAKDSGMEIVVKPPAGNEAFYFVATRKKISVLAEADILGGGEIASLDLTPGEFFVRLKQASGRINPDDLSITTLRTSVVRH
jgi:hypothetical protein